MVFSLFLMLLLPFIQVPASPSSLYIVENITGAEGVVSTCYLVRITIGNGNKLLKERILTVDQRYFSHLGGHSIVNEHYLVTKYGGVIDLQTRKILSREEDGDLLGIEEDRVVYRINNSNRDKGIFAFNWKTLQTEKLNKPGHWALPGLKSPDKTMSVESTFDGDVVLHKVDGTNKQLSKGIINYSELSSCAGYAQLPLLWLDNRRVLTQESNDKLVLLNVDGTSESFLNTGSAPKVVSPPRLIIDKRGQIIYACEEHWLIDVQNNKATVLTRDALGNGFEADGYDSKRMSGIFLEGKPIGRWNFSFYEAVTAPGVIAIIYRQPETYSQPKGLALWNAKRREWLTIEMWVNDIVGWIK